MQESPSADLPRALERPPSRWRSIEWTLPLLMCGLLIIVMGVFTAMAYRAMRMSTIRAAESRMQVVTQQLVSLLDQAARRTLTDAHQSASALPLRAFLQSPGAATQPAAAAELHRLAVRSPNVLGVQLRDARGRRVLSSGPFAPENALAAPSLGRDAEIGKLRGTGDSIWIAVAARVPGATTTDTLGMLVEYFLVSSAQQGRAIGQLIGPDAVFLIGDRDGSLWTDLDRRVVGPGINVRNSRGITRDTVGGGRLGALGHLTAAPWLVWVGVPLQAVLAPAKAMLTRLLLAAAVILACGAAAAWWMSRRLTTPLLDITHAAAGIAAGDYSRRATTTRHDELGRLADSFNAMATQIEEGRRHLESRVAERTTELRAALDHLHAAQQEVVRTEKLAFLGQLAGGVGHELRNPLGVMTNAVHYLGLVLQNAPPKVSEYLDILRAQIGLAERIVGDLLDSARVKTPQREPVPARQLFSEQLQRVGVHRGITVDVDVPADVPYLFVDRVQVGQVVLNLLSNAVQAIGEQDGTLSLRARMDGHQKAQLEISDTGAGVAPEHLEHIFEPLFTTKARGLGLGLSVARALTRANGGDLTVTSKRGHGSTFLLSLPVVARSAA